MIQLRNASLSLLALRPRTLDVTALRTQLAGHLAFSGLLEPLPIVLDLSDITDPQVNWPALRDTLRAARLLPIGVRNGQADLRHSAQVAGWADLGCTAAHALYPAPFAELQRALENKGLPFSAAEAAAAPAIRQAATDTPSVPPLPIPSTCTLLIDKPLRSGQKVYARGGDAVVLAMVSAGAEVIADGSIHVYAPLRGRALAGAQGDAQARIYTTVFEPELVSIAGVWRNFVDGHDAKVVRQATQVFLIGEEGQETLQIMPLLA